ncbi:hypothetical protein ACI2LO_07320 [Streptomyces sp. NPDC033754]|uniref:hypothetical protein n=1 Tax=unclassified Streptomyces TaxID=2593676 RepID=UPI0033DF9E40
MADFSHKPTLPGDLLILRPATEGVLRGALLWEGERVDATVMSILAPEWAPEWAPARRGSQAG